MLWSWILAVAHAREAAWRWVTADDGLASEHVDDLALAPDGMIWIATHGGVFRWDGRRAVRQDGGALGIEVLRLLFDGAGEAWARDAYGGVWRFQDGGVVRIAGADGTPLSAADIALRPDGSVLALTGGRAVALSAGGPVEAGIAVPEGARVLRAGPDGLVVGTTDAFWRIAPDGARTKLADVVVAIDAARADDGAWWLLDVWGTVRRVDAAGNERTVLVREGRGLRLTPHAGEVWVSYDNSFVRVAADGTTEVWDSTRGITSGGPMLFDREGSLWLGTFRGLGQLPDLGAALYDRRDGLPSEALRDLEVVGETVWASGWGGLASVPARGGDIAAWEPYVVKGRACVDAGGGLWAVGTAGLSGPASFLRVEGDQLRAWPAPSRSHFEDACAPADDGGVWITSADGLYRADAVGGPVRARPWPDAGLARVMKALAVAPDGTVWVGGGQLVCSARGEAPWVCTTLPGRAPLTDLAVTTSGAPWVATPVDGVLRLGATGWEPIPGAAALPSRSVVGLAPSPRGGIWVLGHGVIVRMEEAPDAPEGWREAETLAAWLGHLVSGAMDVAELPDGAMWIAHNGGLTHVPATSRVQPSEPPTVTLLELRVDGRSVPEAPVTVLPTAGSGVYLRFVAPTWRAPALVRYRMRLADGAWSELGGQGELELGDLRPGRYAVEVAASLDGERWGEDPLRVELDVPLPWHRRPAVWAAALALVALVTLAIERARMRVERRVERLRTRVALDLHDEIGAGLGAIGLLAGLLGRPGLPPAAAAEAAGRIARTAGDLGRAMRGIVWSLRPESTRMDALGRYLGEQARALLPELDASGHLALDLPEEPVALDLEVLRAVQLVGLEALHNVARHARATRARLALAPVAGGWALTVEDDGVGIPAEVRPAEDGGNGLRSMRDRAASVGARLELGTTGAGGTRVRLAFHPTRRRPGGAP